ncbi:hypothetical protein M011DRAFT_474905 [Sporormia fimetaria CBS 119925]|uniref:F-box domain-containing protein n=1 Tax=Sporormia fimetaria CBS 119925 TaxID=1340428 RepID=A0A6A6VIN1_9PLEO|nr:hypothetical protein M011DRAFT_474905 [Sporormia fimetaria CBS 119925]
MPDASSVEDLTLCQSFADMITLSNLVRRCRSLKVFVYIFEDWSRPAPEDYHHLANALASRSTTLEKMYIYDDRTGDELSSLVKDLAQMLTLKHLTLPLASFRHPGGVSDSTLLILGLPPNLEEFTLNCIEEDGHELLLEILRQVLASVPTRLPRLKVVQLWGQEGVDSSAIRGDLDSYLRKDFERRGINLLTSFWEFPTAEAALGEFPVDVEEEMDDASEDDNEGDERFEQAFQASLGVAYAEDGF